MRVTSTLPQPHDAVLLHTYDAGGGGEVVVSELFITDSIHSK